MATISKDDTELSRLSPTAAKALFGAHEQSLRDPFEVGEEEPARFLKAVIFSEPGAGKTVLAGRLSLPDEKILYIDCEDSASVLPSHPEWFKGRVKVDKFYGLNETAFLLEKIEREGTFQTMVLDSLGSAFDMEMMDISSARLKRLVAKGEDISTRNPEGYDIQDYGDYLKRLKWFIGVILRKKLNVILNAHITDPSDLQISNGQKRRVSGTDNQVHAITSKVGNIFFLEEVMHQGKRHRAIRTRTDGKVACRTRINQLPDYMLDEDFIGAIHNWRLGKPI